MSNVTKEKETIKEVTNPTEKASIIYRKTTYDGYQKGSDEYFEVKDETSTKALDTFKKLRSAIRGE